MSILVPAQSGLADNGRLSLEIGGGMVLRLYAGDGFENWGDGFAGGAGLAFRATENLDLTVGFGFYHFPFKGAQTHLIQPLGPPGPAQRLNHSRREVGESAKGTDVQAYEISISARKYNSLNGIRFLMTLTGGVLLFNAVNAADDDRMRNPRSADGRSLYLGIDFPHNRVFVGMGVGLALSTSDKCSLRIESRLLATVDGGRGFMPIIVTFQFL